MSPKQERSSNDFDICEIGSREVKGLVQITENMDMTRILFVDSIVCLRVVEGVMLLASMEHHIKQVFRVMLDKTSYKVISPIIMVLLERTMSVVWRKVDKETRSKYTQTTMVLRPSF
jgi:hypothetical protein